MDDHSLKALEFERIREALHEHAACELGQFHIRKLKPSSNADAVRARLTETTECRSLLDEGIRLPFGGLHDCDALVKNAAAGAVLLPEELCQVAETLDAFRRLREALEAQIERAPLLNVIAAPMVSFAAIEAAIRRCIGERGEVLDRASEALGQIRTSIRITRSRLNQRLEAMLRNAAYKLMIQDPVLVQRGGRTCIPVKAEYRSQFPGFVHDQSSSGQTVFMEPVEALEIANEVRSLELDEQAEIQRILQDLSRSVGDQAPGIFASLVQAGILDFIHARASYSYALNGVPAALDAGGRIRLRNARHPLLKGEVVPLDIEMDEDRRTVIITGPNTGGKTVALKTVGLLALMTQAGLHVPADPGTRLPVFPAVFADIGDEQSIEQSLSTFSSHLRQIVNVVTHLKPGSLVLLDELGAGTDPAEGAALASTILEHLTNANARVIITSHYGELKEFAYSTPGVENASVQFDEETLAPTYRLQMGIPGRSLALVIAARLGLPGPLVDAARGRVRYEERSASEMIQKLERDQREAEVARSQAERDARDAKRLKERRERELAELDRKRRDIVERAAADAQNAVREAREQVRQILADLRDRSERRGSTHHATEALGAMDKDLSEVRDRIRAQAAPRPISSFRPEIGTMVHVPRFGQRGQVVAAGPDDEVTVAVGNLKMRLSVAELAPAGPAPAPIRRAPGHEILMAKAATVPVELKLLGMRSEEAVEALDKYLDDALLSGAEQVQVIHGKGTGALKNAVWQWLRGHHAVKSYRIGGEGEGGAGATIVELNPE